MGVDWQQAVVVAAVAVAASYLARRAWVMVARKRGAGCGSCGTCPAENAPDGPQVIDAESLAATARRRQ